MNKRTITTVLELMTNLLAGLFVLFILFTATAGGGGPADTARATALYGDITLSEVEYQKILRKPNEPKDIYIYIEIDQPGVGVSIVAKERSIIRSTNVVKTSDGKTWAITRFNSNNERWEISFVSSSSTPAGIKVNLFYGSEHIKSELVELPSRGRRRIVVQERIGDPPGILQS